MNHAATSTAGKHSHTRMVILLPDDMRRQVEEMGEQEERSNSWLMRRAWREFMERHGRDGD